MIVCLGDIHLRDDKPYYVKTCEAFLDWFEHWELNNPHNSLILTGDLVEKNLLTGKVAMYLERLISTSRFNMIYICVGNHDIKNIQGETQLAYAFFKLKSNVKVYEEATEVTIEGHDVLMMPHFNGTNKLGMTMNDYYSSLYQNKGFKCNYELLVGHFSLGDQIFDSSSDHITDIDKLNARKLCLGHIHTRGINPEHYIGSVFAGKKGENDYTRSAWVFDGKSWTEERLPVFNEFLQVTYPNELPKSNAMIPIYTVLNCASEAVAKDFYGDIDIRKTTLDLLDSSAGKNSEDFDERVNSIRGMNMMDAFTRFLETQNINISENGREECLAILKKKQDTLMN